jgi:hypothetical protein
VRRTYRSCPACHKRMRKYGEDSQGARRFYLCECGQRTTYHIEINALSYDWPEDILEDAVRKKLISSASRLLC